MRMRMHKQPRLCTTPCTAHPSFGAATRGLFHLPRPPARTRLSPETVCDPPAFPPISTCRLQKFKEVWPDGYGDEFRGTKYDVVPKIERLRAENARLRQANREITERAKRSVEEARWVEAAPDTTRRVKKFT